MMKKHSFVLTRPRALSTFVLAFMIASGGTVIAQQFSPDLFKSLHWRSIGPFRGGRTRAVAGVPSQPNVFYFAQVNGGVWKTDDYGRTWTPIFDDQPTGSVGSIAVAPSDSNIIYVGSGEGLQRPDLSVGDGIYKSTDAGRTWTHLGLRDGQQIPQIGVDPRDPNRILVAVAGHPYGPNEERGIFRSIDGGKTFERVLYKDENIGGADVLVDPKNPDVAYAALWEARQGPWENAAWNGNGGGVFKSTDNGKTWRQLSGGLPDGIIQANLAIAPSSTSRLFASIALSTGPGIYRSDDGGESWTRITTDARPAGRIGGGDLAVLRVDPKNPEVVYSASVVSWKSIDGGKTWDALRGAPGGDDYQNVWINPDNPEVIILGSDQGAVITVNGGKSWSSWYNQPTAQLYHVNADNAFPYRLCSGQQESGSACVASRGNDGEITFREWHPVSAEEYGYVTPDPLDPDIVYGGKLTRYDRRTGQAQNIMPKPFRTADFRVVRTQPVIFSPVDPHVLYFSTNTLWKTGDGGRNWDQVSPDLTRKTFEVPQTVGKYRSQLTAQPTQRGVIYAVAPSPLDVNLIWAGTDDGLIHRTSDGGANWTEVTPKQLKPWQKISIVDAGHFDKNTAYAAVNTLRLDDLRPHIYRTHDAGATWTEITNGIPDNENTDVVREDPERKGLLFAGTERAVYVSFDDGDHWQSLRLNMGASSVRDLIIKGDDLCVATHGRGFWILDNITPLRQLQASTTKAPAVLFRPQTALRVRWDTNSDTPLPPDVAAGENPPDGVMIDYYIGSVALGSATLEIKDETGQVVRHYSSADPLPTPDPMLSIPPYWIRPAQHLASEPGMHRFLWDVHYAPVPGVQPQYPIAAVYRNTPPAATSPWAMPGKYTVVLAVGGKSYQQPLRLAMDPRVKTSNADLAEQFKLSKQLYDEWLAISMTTESVKLLQARLTELRPRAPEGELKTHINALGEKLQALLGAGGGGPGGGGIGGGARLSVTATSGRVRTLFSLIEDVDVAPTPQIASAAVEVLKDSRSLHESWLAIKSQDIPALNQDLRAAGLPMIEIAK
ncbi:MAG: glycoside hydrolase [Acidobacteriota bacterium]|nr:glycoside hydrolase [Acidobacteriota bacterium]